MCMSISLDAFFSLSLFALKASCVIVHVYLYTYIHIYMYISIYLYIYIKLKKSMKLIEMTFMPPSTSLFIIINLHLLFLYNRTYQPSSSIYYYYLSFSYKIIYINSTFITV